MADLREKIAAMVKPWIEKTNYFTADEKALTLADAILSLIRAEDGWMPIESAPKDGTRVLLWIVPREDSWGTVEPSAVIGDWVVWLDREHRAGMRDGWSWYGSAQCEPTHWRPLPSPPKENTNG